MKKITLDVNDLQVATFATDAKLAQSGTVAAHDRPTISAPCDTCYLSCEFTPCFDYTCQQPC